MRYFFSIILYESPRHTNNMLYLLFIFLISFESVNSVFIYFDSNITNCNTPAGCNFDDPAIWIGGIAPSFEDHVTISDTRPNIKITYSNNTNPFFSSLTLSGVLLELQQSSFSVDTLILENATILVVSNAFMYCYESASISNSSTLSITGSFENTESRFIFYFLFIFCFSFSNYYLALSWFLIHHPLLLLVLGPSSPCITSHNNVYPYYF